MDKLKFIDRKFNRRSTLPWDFPYSNISNQGFIFRPALDQILYLHNKVKSGSLRNKDHSQPISNPTSQRAIALLFALPR